MIVMSANDAKKNKIETFPYKMKMSLSYAALPTSTKMKGFKSPFSLFPRFEGVECVSTAF